jgi:hypothetical protein
VTRADGAYFLILRCAVIISESRWGMGNCCGTVVGQLADGSKEQSLSDLTYTEKMRLEKVLGMSGGYVLDFSNRTFQEFIAESVGLDIYDPRYVTGHSGSKANCLRTFWKLEPNDVVGKLLKHLIEHFRRISHDPSLDAVVNDCLAIITRLIDSSTMTTSQPLVFISYASPDLYIARALADLLADAGLRTWFDKKDLLGGEDWEYTIRKRIAEAALVLVCLSTRAVDRTGFFQQEMRYAVKEAMKLPKGKVYVVPTRIDRCELPDELRQWQAVDLFEPGGSYALLKSIGDALGVGGRARSEAHSAVGRAITVSYAFALEEGGAFKLPARLLGADRYMYEVEVFDAMLGANGVKIHLRVKKHGLGAAVEVTHDATHGLMQGESVSIAVPWQVMLERLDHLKAYLVISQTT